MRQSIPTPTNTPLPFGMRHDQLSGDFPQAKAGSPLLRHEDVARFDAVLHEIHPDAVRVDPDRLQNLLRWMHSLPEDEANEVLAVRLQRMEELRAMRGDSSWKTSAATEERLRKLFAYIDRNDDLIADQTPVVGLLDDVLLFELAWPAVADEAEDYRDFCQYRSTEHPSGSGAEQRAAWITDRVAELAVLKHNHRVNESHYTNTGQPEERFRVD